MPGWTTVLQDSELYLSQQSRGHSGKEGLIISDMRIAILFSIIAAVTGEEVEAGEEFSKIYFTTRHCQRRREGEGQEPFRGQRS